MSEAPNGKAKPKNAPEIVLRDNALRAAAWKNNGESGPFFSTIITRYYKDRDGEIRETNILREQDLLPSAELAKELRQAIRDYKREHSQSQQQGKPDRHEENWHDEDKSRAEIKRDQFKQDRTEQGTRRGRPRDRAAR